jgi:hypothetical protein
MPQRGVFLGGFRQEASEKRLQRRSQTGGLRRKKASEKPQKGGSSEMALDKGSRQEASERRLQRRLQTRGLRDEGSVT